jgi:hypothetical protein
VQLSAPAGAIAAKLPAATPASCSTHTLSLVTTNACQLELAMGLGGQLPQGSCSRRSAATAAAAVPLLLLLALQAPRVVLSEAPVVKGKVL